MKKLLYSCLTSIVTLISLGSCDSTFVENKDTFAPEIESITPLEGTVGTEVTITGNYLNNVSVAKIGGIDVEILRRISSSELVFSVTKDVKSGKITLTNTKGETVSDDTFTRTYTQPSITASLLKKSAAIGEKILVDGNNLASINHLYFVADGSTIMHEAVIGEQSNNEMLITVPYVESNKASIIMSYNNETSEVKTSIASAPSMEIVRLVPVVTSNTLANKNAVGESVTLNGSNLDKVSSIYIGNNLCAISSKDDSSLSFTIPAGSYIDGENYSDLVMKYFDEMESEVIKQNVVIYIPYLKFWENMKSYCQGKTAEVLSSFFSPETGIVYPNSSWATDVDPISSNKGANNGTGSNVPNATEVEYNSVNPYFFFSGVSAGQVYLFSPAGSNSQFKNFYYYTSGSTSAISITNGGKYYGTPVLTFHYLDPIIYSELVNKIKGKALENIDEETFPVDVAANTVGNIPFGEFKTSITSDEWASGKFVKGQEQSNVNIDGVIMILYFNYKGVSISNIKRIGFIHIKTLDLKMYSDNNPGNSDLIYNVYWQKHDYKY